MPLASHEFDVHCVRSHLEWPVTLFHKSEKQTFRLKMSLFLQHGSKSQSHLCERTSLPGQVVSAGLTETCTQTESSRCYYTGLLLLWVSIQIKSTSWGYLSLSLNQKDGEVTALDMNNWTLWEIIDKLPAKLKTPENRRLPEKLQPNQTF